MYIEFKGEPHVVIEHLFTTQGRVSAFNKVKLKSLISGKVIAHVFKATEKVEELVVESRTMQFIYVDGEEAYFMDPKTFEQISIPLGSIDKGGDYLHAEAKYVTMFYEDAPISVGLPPSIALEVVDTTDAVKGNTSGGATKVAKLETGVEIQVPLFIKVGNKVVVNTESGSYIEKVS